jgi:hypothetical protein
VFAKLVKKHCEIRNVDEDDVVARIRRVKKSRTGASNGCPGIAPELKNLL